MIFAKESECNFGERYNSDSITTTTQSPDLCMSSDITKDVTAASLESRNQNIPTFQDCLEFWRFSGNRFEQDVVP